MEKVQYMLVFVGVAAIFIAIWKHGSFDFFDKKDPYEDLKLSEDEIKKKYGLKK